jgi:transposase-like protein
MKRREWDPKTKAQIVLQGLKGTSVAELCNEHRINQAQYYQWRDQFLQNMSRTFDTKQDQAQMRLERENARLKHLLGEMTYELKKTDDLLGK